MLSIIEVWTCVGEVLNVSSYTCWQNAVTLCYSDCKSSTIRVHARLKMYASPWHKQLNLFFTWNTACIICLSPRNGQITIIAGIAIRNIPKTWLKYVHFFYWNTLSLAQFVTSFFTCEMAVLQSVIFVSMHRNVFNIHCTLSDAVLRHLILTWF
jgi:hypothetical protein